MNKKLLLVDGMALLFRSFFATAVHRNFMLNDKGVPTNGVHGFLKHLLTLRLRLNRAMSSAAGTWEAKRTETIYLRTIKRTGASRL